MATMVTDPVCGMQITPGEAAGTTEYAGTLYYFCSRACKQQFDANPSTYVGGGKSQGMPGAPMGETPAKKWWEFWK